MRLSLTFSFFSLHTHAYHSCQKQHGRRSRPTHYFKTRWSHTPPAHAKRQTDVVVVVTYNIIIIIIYMCSRAYVTTTTTTRLLRGLRRSPEKRTMKTFHHVYNRFLRAARCCQQEQRSNCVEEGWGCMQGEPFVFTKPLEKWSSRGLIRYYFLLSTVALLLLFFFFSTRIREHYSIGILSFILHRRGAAKTASTTGAMHRGE